ncbi:MAG: FkbM family methyltransferase [Candidatus Hodarchaeota archaeon]
MQVLGPQYYYLLLLIFLKKTTITYDDISFQIYLRRDERAVDLAQGKCYEPAVTRLIWDLLENESVFWDIGGHTGYYTLLAARKIRNSGNIHVFEPSPINVILRFNLNSFGVNAILNAFHMDSLTDLKECRISGDYYAEKSGTFPDVIKIDVEGWEIQALKGMTKTICRRPLLFIEVHPIHISSIFHANHEFLFDCLSDVGYSIAQLTDFRNLNWGLRSIEDSSDLPMSPPTCNYMLFCYSDDHSEKLAHYKNRWRQTRAHNS